jgi:hypothetical protein
MLFSRILTSILVSKKQNSVTLSTIEAKYIATSSCCALDETNYEGLLTYI